MGEHPFAALVLRPTRIDLVQITATCFWHHEGQMSVRNLDTSRKSAANSGDSQPNSSDTGMITAAASSGQVQPSAYTNPHNARAQTISTAWRDWMR